MVIESVSELNVSLIRMDGGTQPREAIIESTVNEYRLDMMTGAKFPPVVVFYDGDNYWLADGFHRTRAAIQCNRETIDADIRQGTRRDAILYSVGANGNHGLRRTNADKRRAVMLLLEDREWGGESISWIAKKCAVSVGLVHKMKEDLPSFHREKIDDSPRKVTRNGKAYTMNTANIGNGTPTAKDVASHYGVVHQTTIDALERLEKSAKKNGSSDTFGEILATGYIQPTGEEDAVHISEDPRLIKFALDKKSRLHRQIRQEQRDLEREEVRETNRRAIESVPTITSVSNVKFSTIVIDPPWDWGDEKDADQFGRARPTYNTIPYSELLGLPVSKMAANDCHLYLWITNRSLPKGFSLMEAWGFRYITCITWVKPSFGMGNYFRGQTEQVLFGVRGSQLLKRKNAPTVLHAPRGPLGHSSKPVEFCDFVESCSYGPYLEMFGRIQRKDWSVWGEGGYASSSN